MKNAKVWLKHPRKILGLEEISCLAKFFGYIRVPGLEVNLNGACICSRDVCCDDL